MVQNTWMLTLMALEVEAAWCILLLFLHLKAWASPVQNTSGV